MSAEAAEAFLAMPFAGDAVRLRRWDDQAKDPMASTPPLDHDRDMLSRDARGYAVGSTMNATRWEG
jgi:predicted HD phosphohydrolase